MKSRGITFLSNPKKITEQQWESNTVPFLSICTLAYNHGDYIQQSIEGFLKQKTTFPVEIVIHDDASTDNTTAILREYECKYPNLFSIIYQKENLYSQGLKPLRFLYGKVRGEYVAQCEGDDYWTDPLKLQKQVMFLEENEDYVVTHHDAMIVDSDGNLIKEGKLRDYYKKDLSRQELMKGASLLTLSLCLRNVVYKRPEESYNVVNGDKFLISFLGTFGKAHYHNDIMPAVYRVHSNSVWSSRSVIDKKRAHCNTFRMLNKYHLRIDNRSIGDYFFNRYKDLAKYLFQDSILNKDFTTSIEYFKTFLKTARLNKKYHAILIMLIQTPPYIFYKAFTNFKKKAKAQ